MSIFTRCQSLAHPEWLPQFFKDFDSQTALIHVDGRRILAG